MKRREAGRGRLKRALTRISCIIQPARRGVVRCSRSICRNAVSASQPVGRRRPLSLVGGRERSVVPGCAANSGERVLLFSDACMVDQLEHEDGSVRRGWRGRLVFHRRRRPFPLLRARRLIPPPPPAALRQQSRRPAAQSSRLTRPQCKLTN